MTSPAASVETTETPPIKRLALFILEIRKTILILGSAIALGTVGFYFISPYLFTLLQTHLDQKLAFFAVAEPFLAHAKLAFCFTLFILMPWIMYTFWKALSRPFQLNKTSLFSFVFFTCCLFYAGTFFCYYVTLPFGVKFLLGFESKELQSVISVGKFVSFVTVFVLAFGLIFELPVFMIFTAKVGLISRQSFARNRRYALLLISIAAALLTPTPDIINMLLMGGPLYLLYETGILILTIIEKRETAN